MSCVLSSAFSCLTQWSSHESLYSHDFACPDGILFDEQHQQKSWNINYFRINFRSLLVGLPFWFLSTTEAGFSLERENYCFSAVNANQERRGKNNW